jgi:hypothetical protein
MQDKGRSTQGKTVTRPLSLALDPDHRPILPPLPDTSPLRRYGYEYSHDVGMSHIVDYYLHLEVLACAELYRLRKPNQIRDLRIGRYLDGEEEREGLYR